MRRGYVSTRKKIKEETNQLCQQTYSGNFHSKDPHQLKSFSYDKQEEELSDKMPTFYRFVRAAAIKPKNVLRNKRKTSSAVLPQILTGVGILLHTRNRHLNAHQMLTSVVMKRGGANKMSFRRLSSRGLCLPYGTTLKHLNRLSENYDISIQNWKKRSMDQELIKDQEFSICRNKPSEDEKEVPTEEIAESGISCSENTETLPMFYEDWDDTPFQVVSQKLLSSNRTKETKAEPGKADVSEKFTTSKKNDEKELSITSQEQTGKKNHLCLGLGVG